MRSWEFPRSRVDVTFEGKKDNNCGSSLGALFNSCLGATSIHTGLSALVKHGGASVEERLLNTDASVECAVSNFGCCSEREIRSFIAEWPSNERWHSRSSELEELLIVVHVDEAAKANDNTAAWKLDVLELADGDRGLAIAWAAAKAACCAATEIIDEDKGDGCGDSRRLEVEQRLPEKVTLLDGDSFTAAACIKRAAAAAADIADGLFVP